MNLSNDLKREASSRDLQENPLEPLLPSWIKVLDPLESQALQHQLSRLIALDGDIKTIELNCHLLERFDTVRTELLRSAQHSPVSAERLYQRLADHFGAIATYAAQYSRLFAEKIIDPNSVTQLLDLGAGYWNSAVVYEVLFPNLKVAVGLEGDSEKVESFEQTRDQLLKPSREVFQMRHADFFSEVSSLADESNQLGTSPLRKFDLALMQSFYPMVPHTGSLYGYAAPDTKDQHQYNEMLSAAGTLLAPEGKLVVSIDEIDIAESATNLSWFCERLHSLGAIHKNDMRLGINPSWGVLVPIDVSIFIISKDQLQSAACFF